MYCRMVYVVVLLDQELFFNTTSLLVQGKQIHLIHFHEVLTEFPGHTSTCGFFYCLAADGRTFFPVWMKKVRSSST